MKKLLFIPALVMSLLLIGCGELNVLRSNTSSQTTIPPTSVEEKVTSKAKQTQNSDSVKAEPNHALLLDAPTETLRTNKKIVYDFYRTIVEASQTDKAANFLADNIIEHNPMLPSGLANFVKVVSQFGKPKPIQESIQKPLVDIVAQGDIVILVFLTEEPQNGDTPAYTTTWFDMFRVQEGKIVEHWDPAKIENL